MVVVFWVTTLCSLVGSNNVYRWTYCRQQQQLQINILQATTSVTDKHTDAVKTVTGEHTAGNHNSYR